jgi:hypothetical protein
MHQPTSLLELPSRRYTDAEKDALESDARSLSQSLEDLCLSEKVACALRWTGYWPLGNIGVTVHAQLVILTGRVRSYYLKEFAQEIALAVPGVHQIRNDLEVDRRGGREPVRTPDLQAHQSCDRSELAR